MLWIRVARSCDLSQNLRFLTCLCDRGRAASRGLYSCDFGVKPASRGAKTCDFGRNHCDFLKSDNLLYFCDIFLPKKFLPKKFGALRAKLGISKKIIPSLEVMYKSQAKNLVIKTRTLLPTPAKFWNFHLIVSNGSISDKILQNFALKMTKNLRFFTKKMRKTCDFWLNRVIFLRQNLRF